MAEIEQKTVNLPSGLAVTFRRPGPHTQALAVRGVPSLAALPASSAVREGRGAHGIATLGDVIDTFEVLLVQLCMCSITPRFTMAVPAEAGRMSLDSLGLADYNALVKEWGAFVRSDEEAAAIAPLSETEGASSSSTPSVEPTEPDPAPSLDRS